MGKSNGYDLIPPTMIVLLMALRRDWYAGSSHMVLDRLIWLLT